VDGGVTVRDTEQYIVKFYSAKTQQNHQKIYFTDAKNAHDDVEKQWRKEFPLPDWILISIRYV
jgi:hypothetical protein